MKKSNLFVGSVVSAGVAAFAVAALTFGGTSTTALAAPGVPVASPSSPSTASPSNTHFRRSTGGGSYTSSGNGGSKTISTSGSQTIRTTSADNGATWVLYSQGWWLKNADGSYPVNQWVKDGGSWYHFDNAGYMQKGWVKVGDYWYYLDANGCMWFSTTTPDGYYVNQDGVWTGARK